MILKRLFFYSVIGCLWGGISGAALGETICSDEADDQADGAVPAIFNTQVTGDVIVTGSCVIIGSNITGEVLVKNIEDPRAIFIMQHSVVSGRVKVSGGAATLDRNIIRSNKAQGILIERADGESILSGNLVQSSNTEPSGIKIQSVVDTANVLLIENTVTNGNIRCEDAGASVGRVNVLAIENLAPRGTISCLGQ